MSQQAKVIQQGQKVRVKCNDSHGLRFGAICTVVGTEDWAGDYIIEGPIRKGWYSPGGPTQDTQFVSKCDILTAKQANKKVSK